jgi:hypothetical protein
VNNTLSPTIKTPIHNHQIVKLPLSQQIAIYRLMRYFHQGQGRKWGGIGPKWLTLWWEITSERLSTIIRKRKWVGR